MNATGTLAALLDSYEWRRAAKVERQMRDAGFDHSAVRRARRQLGVTRDFGSVRRQDDKWWWRLPGDLCPTCDRPWRVWALEGEDATRLPERPSHSPSTVAPWEDEDASSDIITPIEAQPVPDHGPPRCSICGKASAVEPGARCPFTRPDGGRCVGVVE